MSISETTSRLDDTVSNLVIAQLLFLEAEAPDRDISIYINSPGGEITAGLAIYDTMQILSCDVTTYCVGLAASGGAVLLAGGSNKKRYILPNAMAPLIVQATVSVSYAILAEATLSFLGLGVEATTPTWGLILAEGRSFISRAWWLGVFPGLAIMLTVLSINFLGDALRDFMDVRETSNLI